MTPNKTLKILISISLLPLIFALFLALYVALDAPAISGYFINFARINSYIYAHSYGALLIILFAGIQIGQNLENPNRWYLIFNFCLLGLVWLSFQSFADAQGVVLLIICWMATLLTEISAHQNNQTPKTNDRFLIKIKGGIIFILSILLMINQ